MQNDTCNQMRDLLKQLEAHFISSITDGAKKVAVQAIILPPSVR